MFGTIKSGMATSMFEISVVSNNIANAGTNAFRKSSASFSDLYTGASAESVSRLSLGVGSVVEKSRQSAEQGGLMEQDGVLNLALVGNGMFVSKAPDGSNGDNPRSQLLTFTRDGELSLDKNGLLRTSTNDLVLGYDGVGGTELRQLRVPFQSLDGSTLTALEIDDSGIINATYGSEEPMMLGQIAVGAFPNGTALRQLGTGRFQASAEAGELMLGVSGQDGFGQIKTGVLEASNVNLTTELTSMIRAQQQFSGSSRMLQAYSDMVEKLIR
jgi:flagellar basal-body rod protein FlgG